jgi:lipopolysaccharide export LptBFGC system permease protein LptF
MKKITSVFITAFVFLFSFVNSVFSATTGESKNENLRINRKNEIPSGKIEDLAKFENLNKNVTIEEGKIESLEVANVTAADLVKFENLNKNITLEEGKLENLEQADIKLNDLGKIEDLEKNATLEQGWDIKINNLENKR